METKVQELYKAALKKGDVLEAIRLLHYKPAKKAEKKPTVAKAKVMEEAKVVPSEKKSKK